MAYDGIYVNFQAWEYGLPLCKELAEFYERKIQYDNLSKILVSNVLS